MAGFGRGCGSSCVAGGLIANHGIRASSTGGVPGLSIRVKGKCDASENED